MYSRTRKCRTKNAVQKNKKIKTYRLKVGNVYWIIENRRESANKKELPRRKSAPKEVDENTDDNETDENAERKAERKWGSDPLLWRRKLSGGGRGK